MKSLVKKVKVVPHWRTVLKTYSFWLYLSAIVLTFVEQILPLMGLLEPVMTGTTYAVILFSLNLLGVIAFSNYQDFKRRRVVWSTAA
jgi:predicted membrane metal-binding protein